VSLTVLSFSQLSDDIAEAEATVLAPEENENAQPDITSTPAIPSTMIYFSAVVRSYSSVG